MICKNAFLFKAVRTPDACKGTIPVDYFPVVPDIDQIERVLKENGFVQIPNEPTDTYEQMMHGLVSVDGTYSLEGSYAVGLYYSMRFIMIHAVDSKYVWFIWLGNVPSELGSYFVRTEIVDRNETEIYETHFKNYISYADIVMEIKQLEQ